MINKERPCRFPGRVLSFRKKRDRKEEFSERSGSRSSAVFHGFIIVEEYEEIISQMETIRNHMMNKVFCCDALSLTGNYADDIVSRTKDGYTIISLEEGR